MIIYAHTGDHDTYLQFLMQVNKNENIQGVWKKYYLRRVVKRTRTVIVKTGLRIIQRRVDEGPGPLRVRIFHTPESNDTSSSIPFTIVVSKRATSVAVPPRSASTPQYAHSLAILTTLLDRGADPAVVADSGATLLMTMSGVL